MSICTTSCRSKGNCCRGFELNFEVSKNNWYNEAKENLKRYNLEFLYPIRPGLKDYWRGKVRVQFGCSRLNKDGLCSDYENRPDLCKTYMPQQDPLCCEYIHTLKGIPIILKEIE